MRVLASASCLVLAGAALPEFMVDAQSQTKMKRIEPRQLVRTIESKYVVLQAGADIGWEKVSRDEYNDNTVEYRSVISLTFPHGGGVKIESQLALEEESYFPLSFEIEKQMGQGDVEYTIGARYEWFANVAVVYKITRGVADTSRVALPAGTAVMDMSVAHHLYVPLYWYDGEAGGVQSFNVVDPFSRKVSSATLRRQAAETVDVQIGQIEADRYEFSRDKQTFKVFVDADGRIVKVDQGFLVYELAEWSETVKQGE
jgi:hypothetical protein